MYENDNILLKILQKNKSFNSLEEIKSHYLSLFINHKKSNLKTYKKILRKIDKITNQ